LIFGNLFFPFSEPVPVSEGDEILSQLRGDLVGKDYVWTWNTRIGQKGARLEPLVFGQSTFLGEVYGPSQLRKSSARYVPTLNDEGLAERFILGKMNGTLSVEAIAHQLRAELPQTFPTFQESLNHVVRASNRYSR
jgi:hypothetical protein